MNIRRMIKRKVVTRTAAITLMLCLIFPAFVGLLLYGIGAAEYRVMEADTISLAESQLDVLKGQYNRDLYDHFGLFANTDAELANNLLPQWGDLRHVEGPVISGVDSLYNRDALAVQINSHMALRTPLLSARDAWFRLKALSRDSYAADIRAVLSKFDTTDAYDLIEHPPIDPDMIEPQLENGEKVHLRKVSVADADSTDSEDAAVPEDEETFDLDEAMQPVKDLVVEAERWLIPHYQALELYDPEPCSVSGILSFADSLDEMIRNIRMPGNDLFVTHDYLMRYFTSAVPTLTTSSGIQELRTPYGASMKTLIENGRTHEIEHFIFFAGNPEASAKKAQKYIAAVRFAERLIINGTDAAKKAKYSTEAAVVSGIVAVLSLGTIIIPPVALEWLFLIADSGIDAASDKDDLMKGKGVDSFIAPRRLSVYYTDYLRLFSLAVSRETLLDRFIGYFQHNYGEVAATSFSVDVDFYDNRLHLEKAYVFE